MKSGGGGSLARSLKKLISSVQISDALKKYEYSAAKEPISIFF